MGEPPRSSRSSYASRSTTSTHLIRDAETPAIVVRAIVDRPSPDTMGLHPVVLSLGDRLRISGLSDGDREISEEELERLIEDQHALTVDRALDGPWVGPLCAAWIGRSFAERAEDEGAPELPFERQLMTRVRGRGWFALDTTAALYGALDRWIRQTFVAAIEQNSYGLASLLTSVAPSREETRAAVFMTATYEQRERAVRWWAKLERDAGRGELTRDALVRKVDAVCERLLLTPRPARHGRERARNFDRATLLRCAERLAPAVDPSHFDPSKDAVVRALRLARASVLSDARVPFEQLEPVRIALVHQVYRAWETARVSAHLMPHALHAVESALFGAWDQVELAAEHGFAEIAYPESGGTGFSAVKAHFNSVNEFAVDFDLRWLEQNAAHERVPERFFDLPLWPLGEPPAWKAHVSRFRAKLFAPHSKLAAE